MSQVTGEAWKHLSKAKPVRPSELIEMSEPGDILVTRINMLKVDGLPKLTKIGGLLAGNILSKAQGIPFISSKVVADNNRVIGFSASGTGSKIDMVSFNKFLTYQKNVMLCKYPKITDEQRQKVVKYMKDKRDLDYDTSKLITTWWQRLVKGEKLPGQRKMDKRINEKDAWVWKDALFCSSVIAMAYRAAGIRADFNRTPLEVWPKDFVASKDLDQVAILYQ